jgi:glycosyltransferase involved in cell wall biosynthesis
MSITQYPLITIIAISYNQEKYVKETLDSILAQTYPNIQLIISDDGSTDNTKEIIRTWLKENNSNNNVVFLDHKINRGITKNLNSGLPYVKGEFIRQIGCDDILLPNAVAITTEAFLKQPGAFDVVYTDMYRINEEGNMIDDVTLIEKRGHKVYSGFVYKEMIQKPFITSASMMFSKTVLEKLKKFNEKVFYEDNEFYLRASRYFNFQYIPICTVRYRVHNSSSINSSSRIKYYYNTFYVYYCNYDARMPYYKLFDERILFCLKNLYHFKYKNLLNLSLLALFKTYKLSILKIILKSFKLKLNGRSL